MAHMEYATINHPVSGDVYAVEMAVLTGEDESDVIETALVRVAGPLHHSAPTDDDSLRDYLDNQDEQDCRDDAIWLRREIERIERA